jgi:hypothetical protein
MLCPLCKEEIQDGAIKCKHCGSMLSAGSSMAQLSTVSQQTQHSPFQTKFSLLPNEKLIIDGVMTYKKSTFGNYICSCYLTNQRLVVCGFGFKGVALLGPIAQFIPLFFKLKSITFQIPWVNLSSLQKGKHGLADKLTFNTNNGEEYILIVGTKKDLWYSALKKVTGINIKHNGSIAHRVRKNLTKMS